MGKRGKKIDIAKRDAVVGLFLSGMTQGEIGDRFGCTRQNINLKLKSAGIPSSFGGRHIKAIRKKHLDVEKRSHKFLERYGIKENEFNTSQMREFYRAFKQQEANAATRGIDWRISFVEWLNIWGLSGKLPYRGVGKNSYCMGRYKDCGPYEKGNVYICKSTQNIKDLWDKKDGHRERMAYLWDSKYCDREKCKHGHDLKIYGFNLTNNKRLSCRKCFRISDAKYKKSCKIKLFMR